MTTPCPCGRPANYEDCCGRHIGGGLPTDSAETLMRSRYTAYVLARIFHEDAPELSPKPHA